MLRGFLTSYFPPSAWSDNPKRMREIADRVTGVVATFRRSWETYKKADVPVQYFGHPMVDVVKRPDAAPLAA